MYDLFSYERRFESLTRRIQILSYLRRTICLPPDYDLTQRQWHVIESQLYIIESRLLSKLKDNGRRLLETINEPASIRALNDVFGEIEIQLAESFKFFDTFMDLLSQRCSPQIGSLLSGCDVLAWDAMKKNHPALAIVEPPIVFCDRGFGASILREGIRLDGNEKSPLPTIQIPYSKLKEKYNLTSILHEAGHEVMVRLGFIHTLPEAIRAALRRVNASRAIVHFYSMWMSEIGPDFWTFCNCGIAGPASTMEILSLPSKDIFRVSPTVAHPPPYLRVLLSFEWCKYLWGRGWWDEWERKWLEAYPLEGVREEYRSIIENAKNYLTLVTKTLFSTKFKILNGKTMTSLFDLDGLQPWKLLRIADSARSSGNLKLTGLRPCAQLAVFRLLRDIYGYKESVIDDMMSQWLVMLARRKAIFIT
jgi:hypothetical protein